MIFDIYIYIYPSIPQYYSKYSRLKQQQQVKKVEQKKSQRDQSFLMHTLRQQELQQHSFHFGLSSLQVPPYHHLNHLHGLQQNTLQQH